MEDLVLQGCPLPRKAVILTKTLSVYYYVNNSKYSRAFYTRVQ